MMRGKLIGTLGLCVLALSGCGAQPETPIAQSPAPPAVSSTSAPEQPDAAAREASAVAVAALSAFVDHGRSQDAWWADFSQYLSPEALFTWDGVRADRVTASSITGAPVATVSDATYVSVIVPTDAGSFRLEMVKRVDGSAAGMWLVFEMVTPETGE